MKVLSKEEEAEHYSVVVKAGLIGGTVGFGAGLGGVLFASRRYPAFRQLTLPFRSFLVTSSATFGAIVHADRESIRFGKEKDPMYGYKDATARAVAEAKANEPTLQKLKEWGRENRYSIVFGSWLASMGVALSIVGRDKYLTGPQKLVQARVYAQALAVAMLVVTAALEMKDAKQGAGRWETVMIIDPEDPEHKHLIQKKIHKEEYEGQDLWKDMVAAEERRIAARKAGEHK
ncbi:hypothetical protein CGRA01v4_02430 [Colletotrichum graminicola]|uniref:HIG1 domain-containing protein n=1 Tax=Colletotrichum graminicola (strain M1.001 / M2 / FGSC 10212) TaxID=645133 RepID=E3Q3F3_COLGM|nr:uncharacterized protein GLRG_00699 [Colletotrichum graminicola M1.001]EFQ25555.1 hypothetical protein GLRG_00699 [Colletotrichum graminicola M1.001]WDK11152.1 hypothetical protein CGRA01v4_02430 [Colletotrichum graminicola]